jgi:hypothetical protein
MTGAGTGPTGAGTGEPSLSEETRDLVTQLAGRARLAPTPARVRELAAEAEASAAGSVTVLRRVHELSQVAQVRAEQVQSLLRRLAELAEEGD